MLISDWLLNFKINLVTLLIGCQRVNSVTLGRPNCTYTCIREVIVEMTCIIVKFVFGNADECEIK